MITDCVCNIIIIMNIIFDINWIIIIWFWCILVTLVFEGFIYKSYIHIILTTPFLALPTPLYLFHSLSNYWPLLLLLFETHLGMYVHMLLCVEINYWVHLVLLMNVYVCAYVHMHKLMHLGMSTFDWIT